MPSAQMRSGARGPAQGGPDGENPAPPDLGSPAQHALRSLRRACPPGGRSNNRMAASSRLTSVKLVFANDSQRAKNPPPRGRGGGGGERVHSSGLVLVAHGLNRSEPNSSGDPRPDLFRQHLYPCRDEKVKLITMSFLTYDQASFHQYGPWKPPGYIYFRFIEEQATNNAVI